MPRLPGFTPLLSVQGEALVFDTLGLVAYPAQDLRGLVTSLRGDAEVIFSALDYALHGY